MLNNPGISFGITFPWINAVSGIILIVVGAIAVREKSWQLGLVFLGGALNWWQRVTLGYVVDYWKIPFLPIFNNINDWLIAIGVAAFLWKKLR